jgi:polysaccharide deacetylase 2 family uncharacterized protein YibQ
VNNFKNSVIFILSLIILIQSVILIHFLRQRPAALKKAAGEARPLVPQKPKVPPFGIKPEAIKEKPIVKPKPKEIVGKIVLVLDDWGYNLKNRSFITDNDFHVTISVLPFKPYSTHIAQLAYHKNKDVIVHMPMEPKNKENYGLEQNTLLVGMDKKTVVHLLDSALEVVPYAKGMSNHMGSKVTEDKKLMTIVLEYLKAKKLFFLDSVVTSHSVARGVSKNYHVAFAERQVFIDNESDPDYIRGQLLELARLARRRGVAIGIGHDRPTTTAVLKEVMPKLEQEGYQFVNLSEILEPVGDNTY